MSRSLSSALTTALSAIITQPGYLVTIGFSTPVYLASRGTITINSVTYTGADLEVTGLGADAKGEQSGSMNIGNTDGSLSALILNEANADWPITIQVYDAGAVATGDPVTIFSGTGNGATLSERWATINLISGKTRTQLVPAEYITAEQGFSFLPPAGTRIDTGNGVYVLQPSRN